MNSAIDQVERRFLSFSPAVIYACRADGDLATTFVSDNITRLLGYSTAECLGNPGFWRDNIHPDDCGATFEAYEALFNTGHHIHEYRFRKKDGDYIWVQAELRLLRDAAGKPDEIIGSWIDISGRKTAEAALHKSAELFRAFFHANPVPTIISSLAGVVLMINPAFTRNPGYSAEEVVGKTVQELGFWRKPEDRERMVAAIKEHGFIDNLESTFYGKGNRPMTCLISSRAVEFEGELRILSIVDDVTERRVAEGTLRKLDQAKSDFISTAAHELRTPLVAVVGYCELLENADANHLTEQQKSDYLSIIQNNAETLNQLIDDLLDVGRIQIGRSLGIVRREMSLKSLINNVVDSMRVKNLPHDLVVLHGSSLPATISLDGGRITQVLHNLLDNAIKYSPHGGTIKVQTVSDNDQVAVSVMDQGIGMTAQQAEHIFDRFYRAEFSNAATCGLGLGMNIVKQIIDDHGGEILISSDLGAGTTVTFTLPLRL